MANITLDSENILSQSYTIAIVDDEPDILELLRINLERSGYRVTCFGSGKELFRYLQTSIPSMIILDLMLPDSDGFEICSQIKKDKRISQVPVLMLTARSHESDKVLGLEIGADDYLTKPFSVRELVARVKAILRRNEKTTESKHFSIDSILEIDFSAYNVYVNKIKIELTSSEYKILTLFAKHLGKVFSREEILEHLGNYEKGVTDRTVDVHIRNLREKLNSAGKYIKNIRGIGYKIDMD